MVIQLDAAISAFGAETRHAAGACKCRITTSFRTANDSHGESAARLAGDAEDLGGVATRGMNAIRNAQARSARSGC